jgi:hypothetical protein
MMPFKKNLSKVFLSLVVSSLTMCNNNERAGSVVDDFLVKEAVKKGFKTNNNQLFNKQDSCIFVHFVDHWVIPNQPLFRVFDSLSIYNYRFYFDFEGAVINDLKRDEYVFYGNFDVHYLRFRRDKGDSLKIVPFDNPLLDEIINDNLELKSGLSDQNVTVKLKAFVYELYYSNHIDGIPIHAFEILEHHNFLKQFPAHAKLIPSLSDENSFIFIGKYLGVIVFKWKRQKEIILVEELLISFGYNHLRSDDVMNFDAPPCFTGEILGH